MINLIAMIYLNNRLVPREKAFISVFDHGFLYGDGVYETLRAYKGVVFKIEEHIERLFCSAAMIGLSIPKTPDEIKKAIYKTIKINNHKEAYIRVTVSRGEGPIGLDPDLCPEPTFVIISNEFRRYPGRYYQKGVKIAIVNTRRNYYRALDPRIKSLNFLNNILAKREAKERGAYEAIMLNHKGYLAEGTVSNILFVKDNTLCTPAIEVGILSGITRRIILDIARQLKIKIKEGNFRKEDLYQAQEVFISNTTMEVMPVEKVDDIIIPQSPGEITRKLHKAYKKVVGEYIKGEKNAKYC
jgi:branched-chain amino acid aminotransferase